VYLACLELNHISSAEQQGPQLLWDKINEEQNVGSSLDDWLVEEGIYEEVTVAAIKRVLARLWSFRFGITCP
jgi:hypothetical protein